MDHQLLDRSLAILAMLAAIIVGLMVFGIVFTASSQDFFQSARLPEAYAAYAARPRAELGLRINLGLDNFFVVIYGAFFALLAARFRGLLDGRIVGVALAAMMLTALLDAYENHHILTMVHSLGNGLPVAVSEGQGQMVASQIKFHASYLSVLLFSFGFLSFGRLGRITLAALWAYVPFGVLISVTPPELAKPLVLLRTIFFSGAFVLTAILFFREARARGDGAPAE